MTDEASLRFDDYIDDLVLWPSQLAADPRFGAIVLLGHSEGSLIAMVAAERTGAAAFVSLAGVGRPADELLSEQLSTQLSGDSQQSALDILARILAGETVETVPRELAAVFRPSVQPYLRSWFSYDPRGEITRLQDPVLIAAGTSDIQVPIADADALASALPTAGLCLVDGMSHVLKEATLDPASQQRAYADPDLPVMNSLVMCLTDFLNSAQ